MRCTIDKELILGFEKINLLFSEKSIQMKRQKYFCFE